MSISPASVSITSARSTGAGLPAGLLCVCFVSACGGGGSKSAAPPSSTDVWAVVDGREIKKDDVEKVYRRVAQQQTSSEDTMTAKLSLLNELIVQDILVAKAAALKVEV